MQNNHVVCWYRWYHEQKRAIVESVKGAKTGRPKGETSPDFDANLGVSLPMAATCARYLTR